VSQVKQLKESTVPEARPGKKPPIDRSRLAELMGLTRDGDTITATTANFQLPEGSPRNPDPEVVKAITKDYSAMMKAMKIT